MSNKHKQPKHHTESSPSHAPRKSHDAKARAHNEDVYAGGGLPKSVRYALIGVAAVIVVTLTVMFMGGFIEW